MDLPSFCAGEFAEHADVTARTQAALAAEFVETGTRLRKGAT